MDFTEVIGLIIVLFLFMLPLLRKLLIDKKRVEEEPQEVEEEEEEYIPESPPPLPKKLPSPQRTVRRAFEFESGLEELELRSKITTRELETQAAPDFRERIVSKNFTLFEFERKSKQNPIVSLLHKKDPGKTMVILSEILNRKFE
ncbi:MAG: hypothetical protein JJU12_02030 [Chlamydiales bacterium]|nr:hypothetical protein [Chlamydiales bacterium]